MKITVEDIFIKFINKFQRLFLQIRFIQLTYLLTIILSLFFLALVILLVPFYS